LVHVKDVVSTVLKAAYWSCGASASVPALEDSIRNRRAPTLDQNLVAMVQHMQTKALNVPALKRQGLFITIKAVAAKKDCKTQQHKKFKITTTEILTGKRAHVNLFEAAKPTGLWHNTTTTCC
jgi:hypothetical protein